MGIALVLEFIMLIYFLYEMEVILSFISCMSTFFSIGIIILSDGEKKESEKKLRKRLGIAFLALGAATLLTFIIAAAADKL